MIDLRLIRDDPEGVRAALKRRGGDPPIEDVIALDERRRGAQAREDELRSRQKQAGKEVTSLKGEAKKKLLAELKDLSAEISALEAEKDQAAAELNRLLLEIPNLPHESAPDGVDDDDNVELHTWGKVPTFDFDARDHLDIGERLGIIDVERAAKAAGSRFGYLRGAGAMLWMALSRWTLELLRSEGFEPVVPPVLVRREAMEGTGFLPTDEQQLYRIESDDLFLVGTSEVPLAALHMGEIMDVEALPLRYCGISSCFRREAGAHGRDTRGIFRTHQFEKVEMFVFTRPEDSWEEHQRLIGLEERILQELQLPYRAVNVCTGELGASAAKKVDLEVWFPGQQRYREVTSCSNTTDYQARRLNCRIRGDKGTIFVHTLNGTAVTSSRHLSAILENFQREDGAVEVPKVLRSFTGGDVITLT